MIGNITFSNPYSYSYNAGNVNGVSNNTNSIGAAGKTSPAECETCKNRTYVDGSDEGNVSFKAPGHISPGASASVVASHEQEHVANAEAEGSKEGNELISAAVSLKMSVCPECGTPYVSGGTTTTQIKYSTTNPYEQARKTIEGSFLTGNNIDLVA